MYDIVLWQHWVYKDSMFARILSNSVVQTPLVPFLKVFDTDSEKIALWNFSKHSVFSLSEYQHKVCMGLRLDTPPSGKYDKNNSVLAWGERVDKKNSYVYPSCDLFTIFLNPG